MSATKLSSLAAVAAVASLALASTVAGCDNSEPTKLTQIVEASSPPPPPPSAKPPAAPAAPTIVVDDSSCTIDGEVVLFSAADAAGRIAAVLTGKPLVEGQVVAIDASRDAKVPRVSAVVDALKKAKAKAVLVRSATRDASMGQLLLSIEHPAVAGCSATGMINKDGSIAIWPASGGGAKRFTRGFAGPDVTLGSGGLQKLASGCDSAVWLLAGDDTVPWALPYDLALATRGPGDGGAMRASQIVLLTTLPVAGRKVTE